MSSLPLWSPSSPPFHPPSLFPFLPLSLPPPPPPSLPPSSLPSSLPPFLSLSFPSLLLPFPLPFHLRVSQLAFFVSQWSRLLTCSRSHLVCIKEWSPTPPSRREEQAVEHHQDTKVCTSMYYYRSVQVSLSLILSLSPLLLCLSSLLPFLPLSLSHSLPISFTLSPALPPSLPPYILHPLSHSFLHPQLQRSIPPMGQWVGVDWRSLMTTWTTRGAHCSLMISTRENMSVSEPGGHTAV